MPVGRDALETAVLKMAAIWYLEMTAHNAYNVGLRAAWKRVLSPTLEVHPDDHHQT